MCELVFVYGSLKKDYSNHSVLGVDSKFISNAYTSNKYTMVSLGGFPGVLKDIPTSTIKGEVYKVEKLDRLDMLEGFPTFYNREKFTIQLGNKEADVWMYYLNYPAEYNKYEVIEDGEW